MKAVKQAYKMFVALVEGKRKPVSSKDAVSLGGKAETFSAQVHQPETWEECKGLKGFTEPVAIACLCNYLRHHVLQSKMRQDQLEGKLQKEYTLFFPTGVREGSKSVESAFRTVAKQILAMKSGAERTDFEKGLYAEFEDVEVPEEEKDPAVYLLALRLQGGKL